MRKFIFALIGITFLFTSCSIHKGLTTNVNNHVTEVVLAKKNYKIVEKVKGESKAYYILGIGGFGKDGMIAEARSEMLSNANIIGSSKAIINETVEESMTLTPYFIFTLHTITVSGYVIEFTE